MVLRNAFFHCIVLPLMFSGFSVAAADECGELRVKISRMQSDFSQASSELDRVLLIKPLPRFDAALCNAEWKVIRDIEPLQVGKFEQCFSSYEAYSQFKDKLQNMHAEIIDKLIGPYGCRDE